MRQMTHWRRQLFSREKTAELSAWSSVRRIKILLSAFREHELFNSIGAGVSSMMNRELYRSSESNQAPFQTTSSWLATQRTAIQGCQDGVQSLLQPSCRDLAIWKPSHLTPRIGMWPSPIKEAY